MLYQVISGNVRLGQVCKGYVRLFQVMSNCVSFTCQVILGRLIQVRACRDSFVHERTG